MSTAHEYLVKVKWIGGRDGQGVSHSIRSGHTAALGVPSEFGGTNEGTNPEELLTSAIAACYSITFGIIAANRKLPFEGIETEAKGQVEQRTGMFVFTRVEISPTIRLAADATDEQIALANDIAHKADGYCIITNAVRDKVQIEVSPNIVKG
ncbi:MAG: OsmC family protein [Armatimonadetes bacterium]|nr:OsmC family protein [Armatimonadota bacterium]